jgi:hypothetical protein
VGAQRVIAPGQVLARILVEVAERGRQAVAAVLERCFAVEGKGIGS